MNTTREKLIEITGLSKYFPIQQGFLRRVRGYAKAVDGVDLDVARGETVGLVGESGCGKTTFGRCLLRLYEPTAGRFIFHEGERAVDVTKLSKGELRRFRQNMQMVFQDPFSSLNDRLNVMEIVSEPLVGTGMAHGKEMKTRVDEMITQVGLRSEHLMRYPNSFSGGQRQRIGIARALVVHPQLVVMDEPVSALDVSIQAQILNLLKELQERLGLTYILISHDLSVVRYISDRIGVMYAGKLVELAPKKEVLSAPQHPYTATLLAAVPRALRKGPKRRTVTGGEPPDPANLPSGCAFRVRCPYAEERCRVEEPLLREIAPGHFARCHFSESLSLQGITN